MRIVTLSAPRYIPIVACLVTVTGCAGSGVQEIYRLGTPRERYQAQLQQAGLDGTALGRDWVASGEKALQHPVDVEAPHREVRYLDPAKAPAVAYRLELERGQRLVARLELEAVPNSDLQLFVDLFLVSNRETSAPTLVRSADSLERALEYVARRPGAYLLRVQPELLRGGRVTVTMTTHSSLAFPVEGRDMRAVRSVFGASRDGGRRAHHGVDIFARRGTPVLAAAEGLVTHVGRNRLGGNTVWLRDRKHGRSLYYAHLDSYAVTRYTKVSPGDTLGFVGNTGNARTTPLGGMKRRTVWTRDASRSRPGRIENSESSD